MAFRGDWKSSDEIEADLKDGNVPDITRLVIDLWQRVDEPITK
jgi:RNA polymerase-interacting CarD/CdnL/TRCF family regulator